MDTSNLPPAHVASLKTQELHGASRHLDGGEPVFVIDDGDVEIELSHELGLREPAAAACERLAGALLAHAALIRAGMGSPRRTAYVFPARMTR